MNNEKFNFDDLPFEAQDESITESDFALVDNSKRTHEQKFQTRPTTFFKDSMKRFAKNKSSVVAAGILGSLLLLSFFIPLVDRNDTKEVQPNWTYLQPKLFEVGTGFWDGTKHWEKIAVDTNGHKDATTEEEKQEYWWPSPDDFMQDAISKKTFSDVVFSSDANKYASGGYLQFGISYVSKEDYIFMNTKPIDFNVDDGDIYLSNFVIRNLDGLKEDYGDKAFFPENYSQGKAGLFFEYSPSDTEKRTIKILDYSDSFNISGLNITDILKADTEIAAMDSKMLRNSKFYFRMENPHSGNNECVLIKNFGFETDNLNIKTDLEAYSFDDANSFLLRQKDEAGYMESNVNPKLHMAEIIYCDFTYDSYEAAFGYKDVTPDTFFEKDIKKYKANGWCKFDFTVGLNPENDNEYIVVDYTFEVLDDRCPIKEITKLVPIQEGQFVQIYGKADYYRLYGFDKMPKFLLGTDKSGFDMLKYVFEGLRTSLLLGIVSFAVCFVIGLIWGSISGYFGGNVDLIMERVTDIISGLPWIVVMTLVILHFGSTFFSFGVAICLTGWIGTAATTRTQFYRYRGREYVLASRSLGSSDSRLIFKHILPNSMGTIITSSVLMIPSTIFSEATISYLGLGLKGMSSLGVILSDNQSQLTVHPYLLIFPAVVIALLMISFNLFGNGLRDAVNPSLKGEEM